MHTDEPTETGQLHAILDKVISTWNSAASRWKTHELGAIYTENACLLGGRPGHFVGRSEITQYFASYEGVILCGAIRCMDQVLSMAGSQHVIAQGHVHMSFELGTGNSTSSVLRSTLILIMEGGEWRISHHHFSPIPQEPPLGNN